MKIITMSAILFFLVLPMSLAQAMESFNTKRAALDIKIKNLRSQKSVAEQYDVLLKHVRVIQELKEKFAAKSANNSQAPNSFEGLTQTEVHIKIYEERIKQLYIECPWLEPTVKIIIEQEKIHDKTHYVFYHSHIARLNILQDFMKALHQFLSLAELEHFHFLRNPHEIIWKETIEKVLNNEIHDHNYFWPTRLLSVNLAFFGNLMDCGESSFTYYLLKKNMNPPAQKQMLQRLFSDLGIDGKYIAMLEKLAAEYHESSSVLLQIFVPKDKVDDCVYLALPYGKPYPRAILQEHFDADKSRHTRVAPILDYYKAHPEKITDLDKLQARILFSRDILLNPESGVRIMRYGQHIVPAQDKQYRTKIKEIALEVIKDHLKNNKNMVPVNPDMGKPPLQRIQELRARL